MWKLYQQQQQSTTTICLVLLIFGQLFQVLMTKELLDLEA